jgi:hypothetical protein
MEANRALISPRHRCDLESLTKRSFVLRAPDYFLNDDPAPGFATGFGDLSLGFKQQPGPTRGGADLTLRSYRFVSLPTGANPGDGSKSRRACAAAARAPPGLFSCGGLAYRYQGMLMTMMR